MKQSYFTVSGNRKIADGVYEMILRGSTSEIKGPGQFINIKLDGFYLRRPISVCDYTENTVTVIYKTVGKGTEAMSCMEPGTSLDILSGLGNGFDISKSGPSPLVIGGGAGAAPMYCLSKKLVSEGKAPVVICGFNSACDVYYEKEFESLGVSLHISTVDGTYGARGFVTDAMKDIPASYFYACGPEPMFRAVDRLAKEKNLKGQYSLESRMGCGFGACMGCSCKTVSGIKRICKDGPVFESEEIIWEN